MTRLFFPSLDPDDPEATKPVDYSSLVLHISLVSTEVERKLQNQMIFVVESNAIGCEILKNLAAMGAGTGKFGVVIVTDMDTI